jgi:hypothetical protein
MAAAMCFCLTKRFRQQCRKKAAFLKRGSGGGCLFFDFKRRFKKKSLEKL